MNQQAKRRSYALIRMRYNNNESKQTMKEKKKSQVLWSCNKSGLKPKSGPRIIIPLLELDSVEFGLELISALDW